MTDAKKSNLPKEENLQGINDELGQDSIGEAKVNAKKELELFSENIIKIKEAKERFIKMWNRDEKLYHIMIDAPRKIVLVYEYEKSDEYWAIRKEQLVEKYEEDKFMAEAKIKQYDTQLEDTQEQIDSIKELLSDLEGE